MLNFIAVTNQISDISLNKIYKALNDFFIVNDDEVFKNVLYLDTDYNVSAIDIMLKIFDKEKTLREAIYELEESIDGIKDIGLIQFLLSERNINKSYEIANSAIIEDPEILDDDNSLDNCDVQLEFNMTVLNKILKKYDLFNCIKKHHIDFHKSANEFRDKVNKVMPMTRFNDQVYIISKENELKQIYGISFKIDEKQFSLEGLSHDFIKEDDFKELFVKAINKNFKLDLNAKDAIKDFDEFLKILALVIY